MMAESLPVRAIFGVILERRQQSHCNGGGGTLPKREILCLTRAASLQNRLQSDSRDGKEEEKPRENKDKRRNERSF